MILSWFSGDTSNKKRIDIRMSIYKNMMDLLTGKQTSINVLHMYQSSKQIKWKYNQFFREKIDGNKGFLKEKESFIHLFKIW